MAQITGHKVIREPVQITVDNRTIWELVRSTCMKTLPANAKGGVVYTFKPFDPLHSVFDRYTTEEENEALKALALVEKLFYENCKD